MLSGGRSLQGCGTDQDCGVISSVTETMSSPRLVSFLVCPSTELREESDEPSQNFWKGQGLYLGSLWSANKQSDGAWGELEGFRRNRLETFPA